jgi:hypothetical protein
MNTLKKKIRNTRNGKSNTQTQAILSGAKTYNESDALDLRLKGYDSDGTKVQPFDFIAITHKNGDVDFLDQADANCSDWVHGGYVIDTPLTSAWKNLERAILDTIKSQPNKIVIKHKDMSIIIDPKGGKKLDCSEHDKSKNYPTFEFKNIKTKDSVSYEYFQLSAHDRALIALDLIEELK